MRYILLLHRYLAVAVGLLMVLWCLSGFVMMYQSYPSLSPQQQLAGLAPLDLRDCCTLGDTRFNPTAPLPALRVEMLLGDPVLRFSGFSLRTAEGGTSSVLNLRTGQALQTLNPEQVLEVARQYGRGNAIVGEPHSLGIIDIDQWTLQSARRNRPTWHFAFDDTAATEIYVSGASGEVFQKTTRRERVLAWLGAIPHWLYPTALRQNGALWNEIVIWSAVAGSFLAATGLYVGIARLRRNRAGQWSSPFRGWWYWHHVSGLVFGILTLTWVFSGLLTMNPWGALSGGGGTPYRQEIQGRATWSEFSTFLSFIVERVNANKYQRLETAPFNGRFYALASQAREPNVRLDVEGRLALLTENEVRAALTPLSAPVLALDLLLQEDSYYYGGKGGDRGGEVNLPVYRVSLADAENTRLYIDKDSGAVRTLNADGRWSRWLRTGLHDLDFAVLRQQPVWDIVVMLLLAGVTLLCLIGTWLAIARVRLDWRILRGRWRRRASTAKLNPHSRHTDIRTP
ncbi:MAG: PepSY domain-containing protein [Pseudomonadales bacterium]|jgi:hypothetical protein|nr:PepSY domain-containing protein [Pseudomonadales bacterium]